MQDNKKPFQIIASSALSSTIISILTNPLDVVKTRLQRDAMECKDQITHDRRVRGSSFNFGQMGRESTKMAEMHCECMPHNSTIKVIAHIARNEGLRTLGNGLKSSMIMSASSHTTFMFLYETVKKAISQVTNHNVLMPLSASLLTRVAVTSFFFPLDYFRTVQQSSSGESKIGLKDLRFSAKAGYGPLIVRDVVFSSIYWVSIENIRRVMMNNTLKDVKYMEKSHKILLANSISGGISGCIAALITLPFDVVKTRMQINENLRSLSSRQVMLDIYSNEGISALFTGCRQRVGKASITCSGALALYEYFNHIFQRTGLLE